jgi:hypothetical protein
VSRGKITGMRAPPAHYIKRFEPGSGSDLPSRACAATSDVMGQRFGAVGPTR